MVKIKKHAYANGLKHSQFTDEGRIKAGKTRASQTSKPVRWLETGLEYPSARECARQNGFDGGNVIACCNHNRRSHHGQHFEWI